MRPRTAPRVRWPARPPGTGRDPARLPIRARSHPGAGTGAAVTRGRSAGGVQLGAGPGEGRHGSAGSGSHVRDQRGQPDPGHRMVAVRVAQRLERCQGHGDAVVGGCSKEAFNAGLDQLARALRNWAGSRTGQRKGKPAGFPRFRSRRKARPSIRFTTGAFGCKARHAVLPRIGRVKLHEPGTRLAGLVTAGTHGRWACRSGLSGAAGSPRSPSSSTVPPLTSRPGRGRSIDLGIKTLAVLSTGEEIPSPRHLDRSLRKVRRLSRTALRRRGPDRRTRRPPSNRWRRASSALGKADTPRGADGYETSTRHRASGSDRTVPSQGRTAA